MNLAAQLAGTSPALQRVSAVKALDTTLVDQAIYDLMVDGTRRNVKLIIASLCSLGYHRLIVDKRIDALFAKKWFDRHGSKGQVEYTLKKDIVRPADKPVDPVVLAAMPNPNGLTEDDDDMARVWKVLADHRGRRADEVFAVLHDFDESTQLPTVETMCKLLANSGFLATQQTSQGVCVYTLKKGLTMPSEETLGQKARGVTLPNLQGTNPAGHIDLSEGIMVCLWKVMADYKPRTQPQVFSILAEYGINMEVSKQAFIKAHVNLGWFDVRKGGVDTRPFTLKKHIKMPKVVPTDPETLRFKATPGGINVGRRQAPLPMHAPSVTMANHSGYHHHFTATGQRNTPAGNPLSSLNAEMPETAAEARLAEETISTPTTPRVEKGDSMEIAIWKVMSDFQPYTANDIALLLEEHGFVSKSVKVRMSTLFGDGHNGWFTRINNPQKPREYIYTLKREIECPAQKEPVQVTGALDLETAPVEQTDVKASAPVAKVAEVPPQTNETKETHMNSNVHAMPTKPADQPAALLEVQVRIKGQLFGLTEARELGKELIESGFADDGEDNSPAPKFLKLKVEIAGMEFTMEEVTDLASQMKAQGLIA